MLKKIVIALFLFLSFVEGSFAEDKVFVDVFLAPERKADAPTIKKILSDVSIDKVSIQFFRKGNPPQNIAVGSGISADVARLVIDLATTYNMGVTHLMPQFRFHPNQIAIGTSAFDELVPVAISPADLERLKNPALSTVEFRRLYRELTHEKQKKD
ncbi:MAG: hypothetical protein AAB317_00130 [Nitrospirota bacterium]